MSSATAKISWADIARRGTCQAKDNEIKPESLEPPLSKVDESEAEAAVLHDGQDVTDEVATSTSGDESDLSSVRTPGSRGEKRCWCRGELLVMLGHYGWIMSLDDIDHPQKDKNGGRIYVHQRDISGRDYLKAGDRVGFYLYADHQGLGAEDCRLEQKAHRCFAEDGAVSDASTDAPVSGSEISQRISRPVRNSHEFNVNAPEFKPHAWQQSNATSFQVMIDSMINPAYLFDDSDSDEESDSGNEADGDSCSDGDDARRGSVEPFEDAHLKAVISNAPWKSRRPGSKAAVNTPIGAPPGLSLPGGTCPPPGLCRPPGL